MVTLVGSARAILSLIDFGLALHLVTHVDWNRVTLPAGRSGLDLAAWGGRTTPTNGRGSQRARAPAEVHSGAGELTPLAREGSEFHIYRNEKREQLIYTAEQ